LVSNFYPVNVEEPKPEKPKIIPKKPVEEDEDLRLE